MFDTALQRTNIFSFDPFSVKPDYSHWEDIIIVCNDLNPIRSRASVPNTPVSDSVLLTIRYHKFLKETQRLKLILREISWHQDQFA